MEFEIKNRWNGSIIFAVEAENWRSAVEAAIKAKANLHSADLSYADLSYADLRSANLSYANLSAADLSYADLRVANLSAADLSSADLRAADLRAANLSAADLRSADLRAADLRAADLSSAKNLPDDMRIETGETWKEYKEITVPALLAAGGHKVSKAAWTCHEWDNCPMAQAFGVKKLEDVPVLFRPRAEQFVRYFDAKLIPAPDCLVED